MYQQSWNRDNISVAEMDRGMYLLTLWCHAKYFPSCIPQGNESYLAVPISLSSNMQQVVLGYMVP